MPVPQRWKHLFVVLFLSFPANASTDSKSNDRMRDYRGRGRGSVSRLSFSGDPQNLPDPEFSVKSVDEEKEDEVDDRLTAIGTPPPNLFHVVMPPDAGSNFTPEKMKGEDKNDLDNSNEERRNSEHRQNFKEEPKAEDYEKLAKILQRFVSRQKAAISTDDEEDHEEEEEEMKEMLAKISSVKRPTIEESSKKNQKNNSIVVPVSLPDRKKATDVGNGGGGGLTAIGSHHEMSPTLERISWSGSVEKVEKVEQQPATAPKGEATASKEANLGRGLVVQANGAPIRPQILGKVLIQPSRLLQNPQPEAEEEGKATNTPVDESPEILSYEVAAPQTSNKNKDKKLLSARGKAYVSVLREGLARQSGVEYTFVASITLIRDQGKTILVDTGLATDINGRTDLLEKLGRLNIAPPAVDFVVTTHGHADHSGNTNDFPDAIHFQGTMSHHRTRFNISELFEEDEQTLTENVVLIRTPGHTADDISVVVSNTDRYGTVIVAGDVFMAAEDMDFPLMWRPLAWNETAQEESRRRMLCWADYVVPGHGKVFRVTDAMRTHVLCDEFASSGRSRKRRRSRY